MGTKKMISWPLAVLLAMSLVVPTVATNDAASDYLPLAVGNSWTYEHDVYDLDGRYGDDESQWTAYSGQEFPRFTITVERTEVVGDTTYYVISDMPANWPPAPPHFIAGKKLRWEGTHPDGAHIERRAGDLSLRRARYELRPPDCGRGQPGHGGSGALTRCRGIRSSFLATGKGVGEFPSLQITVFMTVAGVF